MICGNAVAPTTRIPAPHSRSAETRDRKSTRLNSSHSQISYAVFCLKKKENRCLTVGWDVRSIYPRGFMCQPALTRHGAVCRLESGDTRQAVGQVCGMGLARVAHCTI